MRPQQGGVVFTKIERANDGGEWQTPAKKKVKEKGQLTATRGDGRAGRASLLWRVPSVASRAPRMPGCAPLVREQGASELWTDGGRAHETRRRTRRRSGHRQRRAGHPQDRQHRLCTIKITCEFNTHTKVSSSRPTCRYANQSRDLSRQTWNAQFKYYIFLRKNLYSLLTRFHWLLRNVRCKGSVVSSVGYRALYDCIAQHNY